MKLAVHKDTRECVAVKIVHVDEKREGGITHECLRKEVLGVCSKLTKGVARNSKRIRLERKGHCINITHAVRSTAI